MSKFNLTKDDLASIVVYNPKTTKFFIGKELKNISQVHGFFDLLQKNELEEYSIDIDEGLLDIILNSSLLFPFICGTIGMAIVVSVFYVYNRMIGNIKKRD